MPTLPEVIEEVESFIQSQPTYNIFLSPSMLAKLKEVLSKHCEKSQYKESPWTRWDQKYYNQAH